MNIDYYIIGKQIRNCRKKKKLSQAELAEIINISPSFMSCIENGYRIMSIDTLVAIANALEVTVDILLAETQNLNLDGSAKELTELLKDCSDYERRVIIESAIALKASLRENWYLYRKHR